MLDGLVSLYDVDGGALYLSDEDGLALRRAATAGAAPALPNQVALGDATLGQVALERRARVIRGPGSGPGTGIALLAAPVTGGGRLLGVIVLGARESRPVGRRELLLLHAFAGRVGEILADDQRRRAAARGRDRALPGLVVGGLARLLSRGSPARAQACDSLSTASALSRSGSIGATVSIAHRSSTRRIGVPSGTTSLIAWRRAARRRPRSNSRWTPALSR